MEVANATAATIRVNLLKLREHADRVDKLWLDEYSVSDWLTGKSYQEA